MTDLSEFHPRDGELYAHVFENSLTGVPRGLYWTVFGDFAPLVIDGSEWDTSLLVEWLTFDARRWADLSMIDLASIARPELVEASVYFTDIHQNATLEDMRLRSIGNRHFEGLLRVSAELELLDGTVLPRRTMSWAGSLEFKGIYVIPENLFPKPSTPEAAAAVLSEFLHPSDFMAAEWDKHRFVFLPR